MTLNNFQKTIAWYNKHASEYAEKVKLKAHFDELDKFKNYLPVNAKVLDAGCAAGRDSRILKEFGFYVTGIDISKEFIKIATLDNPDIEFLEADILNLPFKESTFDGIWASASLVHFETKTQFKQALMELWRVLKKNGILYFCIQGRTLNIKSGWVKDDHSQEGRFFQFFNLEETLQLINKNNFEVVDSFERKSSRAEINWSVVYLRKK